MRFWIAWRRYILTLTAAILAALFVRNELITAYRVPTGTMQPALKPGDFIFSFRPAYGFKIPFMNHVFAESLPSRGDLVIFNYPNQPGVNSLKRVVALPGDRLQIVNNHIILNNRPFNYAAVSNDEIDNPNSDMFEMNRETDDGQSRIIILEKGGKDHNFGPLVVPTGEVFLLGDNRDTSDDSRYWGTVPLGEISGKAVMIWLSIDWQNKMADRVPKIRWNRVFTRVH